MKIQQINTGSSEGRVKFRYQEILDTRKVRLVLSTGVSIDASETAEGVLHLNAAYGRVGVLPVASNVVDIIVLDDGSIAYHKAKEGIDK